MNYICKFDELIHEKLQNDYILSLKKCELIRDTRSASYFFAVSVIPDAAEKERILNVLRGFTPKSVERISAGYTRIYFDEEVLRDFLKRYFQKNAASMLCGVDFAGITLAGQELNIPVDHNLSEHLKGGKLASTLENVLSAEYYAYFKVNFRTEEVFKPIEKEEILVAPPSKRNIAVNNRAKFIGNEIVGDASYIADICSEGKEVVLCGRIKYLTERKKVRDDGRERIYFTFELLDFTGKIRCVCFPAESNLERFRQLKDEDEVLCSGDCDVYNSNPNYSVRSISHCELPKDFVPENPPSKPASSKYCLIFPQPYFRGSQVNLFGEVSDFTAPALRANTYVAFDLETTGLESESDKIIEIGAALIRDGKVTESFSTFVNPGRNIPEKITELTGIDNNMVKHAPSIGEVMPDFYKFTRDAILVGHNIDGFDMKFVQKNAVDCGYYFENETVDTLLLARQYLHGLPNYRLDTVAEFLNVTLESHHRATDDAICSGDILIEILNRNAKSAEADGRSGDMAETGVPAAAESVDTDEVAAAEAPAEN